MDYFKKRNKIIKKSTLFLIGLIITAIGVVYMIKASNFGVQPFDALNIGIHQHSSLSIGKASIMIGLLLLLLSYAISKERLKIGTILDAIFLGLFVDFFLYLDVLMVPETLFLTILYFIVGIACIAFGAAMTIYSDLGAGPIDTFILAVHKKLKVSFKTAATVVEIVALAIAFFLGGPIGIGTLLYCLFIGLLMEISLKRLKSMNILGDPKDVVSQEIKA